MTERYFQRVTRQTPTKFWINNPTRDQAGWAIAEGALGCTNNPSYSQKMIDHPVEGGYASKLLDEALRETGDNDQAIALFQRKLVKPIADKFMVIYRKNPQADGYVSIQGDPINEHDPAPVIDLDLMARIKLFPGIICA